ncbi:formin-like protein 13 isoform X1 [Syngnathus acus]|uniref:formin-like protein 13 isoform X1 n=1 Tax=Syngnathus acus TaxID=161584 RepID=UPI001885B747|nr:formin-like protein 13 isoform X1 [Syngnathus acus]
MPSLGAKKKDNVSRMERFIEDLPQLSNEMQLSIMHKVKTGELSIDDALELARKDRDRLTKLQSSPDEEELPSQYNFSVHKHGRYRWKKRVLQMDFTTKMLCTIEKGIIKRQLPFVMVKSCDDGVGSRFSISFKGHNDYELEATSVDDKHKIMQLVNQIIYGNIYSHAEGGSAGTQQLPQAPQTLREGVLMLHRGGLASFRWVKYEVQLHPGQLTLVPFSRRATAEGDLMSSTPVSTVIHLSDGDTSVQKRHRADTFTLVTRKNEYDFRVPPSCQPLPGAVQTERDAWVHAISKLCSDWKRKSKSECMIAGSDSLRHLSIAEDAGEDNNSSDVESPGEDVYEDPNLAEEPSSSSAVPDVPTQIAPDPNPSHPGPPPSNTNPPNHLEESLGGKVPSSKTIPLPPPLPPLKLNISPRKNRTKAFHWDLVGPDKIMKSFWGKDSQQRLEVDTRRLYMQFSVKNVGSFAAPEPSGTQHIMLNQKIAHNFNIFLKSFAVQPAELKDKLFIINEEDGGLSDEHITSLRRYVPTLEDVEMYKSYKGPVSELHIVDQYMMEMCDIPYLSTQLDLLLTLRELPISMRDLQPLIGQKIAMSAELQTCRSFVAVLEYLLAIGNYLNENAGKKKAKGFRLSALAKLSQLRGREPTFTLLHALVEQIMLHEPVLANFTNELAEFEAVPGASVKGLTAEVDVLKNELQKVIQYGKTSKKRNVGAHHAQFSKDLKVAVEKYNTELLDLMRSCEEMKKLYSGILVKFGEAADQDSQELFGFICQFIHDFKRARAEVI